MDLPTPDLTLRLEVLAYKPFSDAVPAWYEMRCPELNGVVTDGTTLPELLRNLADLIDAENALGRHFGKPSYVPDVLAAIHAGA